MENKSLKNRIHGSIIGSRLAFVEQQWGKQARQKLIDKFPIKERQQAESVIFENNWFDLSLLELLDKTIVESFANSDLEILHEVGRFSAEYNYHRLPSQLRTQKPEEILKSVSRINVLFQDFGETSYEDLPEENQVKGAAISYSYNVDIPSSYCASALGYFERLLELCGYAVVKVQESACQSHGDLSHRYEIWWKTLPISQPIIKATGKLRNSLPPISDTNSKDIDDTSINSNPPSISNSPSFTGSSSLTGMSSLSGSSSNSNSSFPPLSTSSIPVPGMAKSIYIDSKEESTWLTTRVKVLICLIVVSAFIGFIELGYFLYSYLTSPKVATTQDKIILYKCAGTILPEVRLDKPYLLINSHEEWTKVTIALTANNQKYIYSPKKINAQTIVEIDLESFKNKDNKPISIDVVPETIFIDVISNKVSVSCACK